MRQNVYDARISKGRLEISNLPFADEQEVKVMIMPKFTWDEEAINEIRRLTSSIKGNLSDDISAERDER